jgi:LacI family transcriptional regulator
MSERRGPSSLDEIEGATPARADRAGAEPSMRDVALRAQVSTATVSRVLNGSDTVGADARDRVRVAVAELGYRPNRLARNLRRQNAEMIGVVISDIENPHFTEMVRAAEDAAFSRGYRMLLCNTDEQADKQRAYLDMLAGERVSGVILSPSEPAGEEIRLLLDLGIPVVAFDRHVNDERADSVVSDGRGATRTATEHMIAAGHTAIAFLGGRPGVETAEERRAGYEAAMRDAGLEPHEADGDFRIEGAVRATEELLRDHGDVTALVIGNNLMAIGAMRALVAHRRRVPEDIALIALDDPFWAALVQPPLSVLAQPVRRMTDAAMRVLLERIGGSTEPPQHQRFPFELKVRGSCGTEHLEPEGRA